MTDMTNVVYFIVSGNLIKIGTTVNLDGRLRSYNPDATLLGTISGGRSVEHQVHRLFAAHHSMRREWFADSVALRADIADLVEGRKVLPPLKPTEWGAGGWQTPGEFGALYREVRTVAGLTQQAAAESAGVSRKWLSEFEQGKATVELGMVLRCFAALGVTFTPSQVSPSPPGRSTRVDG